MIKPHPFSILQTTVRRTHAQQHALLEQCRRAEQQREDSVKELTRAQMEISNMAGEERAEAKRLLRQMQLEQKERDMDERIRKVTFFYCSSNL